MSGITLLTGASGGLGREITKLLLAAGVHRIACQYHSNKKELECIFIDAGLDPEKHLYQADLTSEHSVAGLRNSIEQRQGKVVNLINLAGGSKNGMSWKVSVDDIKHIIGINLISTMLCCREFIPGMRENGNGRIINTSSIVAYRGAVGAAHYAAAKAGILGYSKSLSLELASKSITVNTLALGYMNAGIIDQVPDDIQMELIEQTPLKRLGTPADVATSILYLLDQGNDFMTGQVLHINGGLY